MVIEAVGVSDLAWEDTKDEWRQGLARTLRKGDT